MRTRLLVMTAIFSTLVVLTGCMRQEVASVADAVQNAETNAGQKTDVALMALKAGEACSTHAECAEGYICDSLEDEAQAAAEREKMELEYAAVRRAADQEAIRLALAEAGVQQQRDAANGPNPEEVRASFADARKKAEECAKNGNLVVSMTLNGNGKASNILVNSGSFQGTPTEKCILTVIEMHPFPTFSGLPVSGVRYDFKL